ncbi:MAG: hypothetical protein JO041_05600 [Acidobacteria bacterium]|nr:hypothetical protein [Acidobacteriota bacterium]
MRRAVTVFLLALLALPAGADQAHTAYKAGLQAEVQNNSDAAYEDYKHAYELKPKDPTYMAAYTRMRFRASSEHVHKGELLLEAGKLQEAIAEFQRAVEVDSSNALALQEMRRARAMAERVAAQIPPEPESPLATAAQEAQGPVTLRPVTSTPINLRMTENTKSIYKIIGGLVGINVLFDPEYTPRKISVELDGVSLNEALDIIALASKTFWRPITANTIYVTTDNPGKRKEVEQSVIKTFYLSNIATASDLSDAANSIRTMLDLTKVQQVASQNALIVRGTPDQLVLVEKLLNDIDKARPECMIDVAILEVTRERLRTLGGNPPTSISGAISGVGGSGSGGSGLTLNNLASLTANNIALSIPGASFTALMSDSHTKIIQNPQVRVIDNQQAQLKIGERVPVATGSFSPGVGSVGVSPLVNTQFQYLDVGVNISITPRIHSWHEVTLKIVVEVSSVTGQENIGGVTQPIIGQRRIEHETRLREGEVNLLGGILQDSESDSISGLPWLTKIPLLKLLFGQDEKTRNQEEIVFAITPHIVRAQDITPQNLREIDLGNPNTIQLRYGAAKPAEQAPAGTAPAPSAGMTPAPGVVAAPPETKSQPTAPATTAPPAQPAARPPSAAGAAAPPDKRPEDKKPEDRKPAPAPGTVALNFEPTTTSQKVGSKFTVNISANDAKNAFSIPLQINYDPKILDIADVANAGFLSQDGQPVAVVFRPNAAKGTLQITGTRPPNSGGVSGSGPVFAITLVAKAPGETVLDISGATVLDPTLQELPAQGGDLLVTVTGDGDKGGKDAPAIPKTDKPAAQP